VGTATYEHGARMISLVGSEEVHWRRPEEELSDTGWTQLVVEEERPPYRPWDRAPWNGDVEAYREDLYGGMAFGLSDLRAFAQEWLEELVRVGYHGTDESLGLPLKQQTDALSTVPRPLPFYGEVYPMRFENGQQVLWLQLDVGRSERGYKNMAVSDEPLRTDKAILAALTALEGRLLDTERLRKALRETIPSRGESVWDLWVKVLEEGSATETISESSGVLEGLQHHQALDYVLTLLRHHRPEFDDLPHEERVALMVETCTYINAFLEALRKFVAFLEHGTPGRRGPATTKLAARDVKAIVLRDVDGLTYREIGRELGIPPPKDFDYKGDHPTVRKMVRCGREILKRALGEEGWWRQVEAMKAEAERWRSMSEMEREAELEAEALNISFEQALRRIEEERDRRNSGYGDRPGIA
jgi:hypothetical protein